MLKIRLGNKILALFFSLCCMLYMPVRAFVEMAAATGALPEDFVAKNFFVIRALTPAVVVFLFLYFAKSWAEGRDRLFIVGVFFYFFISFSNVLIYGGSLYDKNGVNVQAYNLGFLFSHLLCLGLGVFAWHAQQYKTVVLALWGGMVGQVVSNFDLTLMSLAVGELDAERLGVYLLYGDTFAVWSLLVVSAVQKPLFKALVFFPALVVSFVLYSRTSFFGFLVVSPFLFFTLSFKLRSVVFLCAFVAVVYFLWMFGGSLSDHRMFEFLVFGNDESLAFRQKQVEVGIRSLFNNLVLGDYAGQVRDFGEVGAYIHNMLSYWQQFGFIVFFVMIYFLVLCFKRWIHFWGLRSFGFSGRVAFFVYIFPFVLFEVVFSRSYVYPYVWLLFGVYLGLPRSSASSVRLVKNNIFGVGKSLQ